MHDDDGAQAAYDRGRAAGEISARLDSHETRLASLNGSLAEIAKGMADMALGMQRLGDQADSSAKTAIATAAALREAEELRRIKSERAWSPVQRLSLVVGLIATMITTILVLVAVFTKAK